MTNEGVDVRYIRSTWVPDGERYRFFESSSTAAVGEVQKRANVPSSASTKRRS